MSVGIIACAFGQQRTFTAGPSNEAIGDVALYIKQLTGGVVSTQWEVEAHLKTIDESADHIVSYYGTDSHYVTTQEVFDSSLTYFASVGVTDIVIVAHPLHLPVIRLVMKDWDIDPKFHFIRDYDRLMRMIPFDRSEGNVQDWTRGPIRFGAYLVRAKLTGNHGN